MDDLDRAVLELESCWYRHAGTKEAAARELGLGGTAYWQRLNRLLGDAEAAAEFPELVNRLRRLRARRLRQRRVA
jgi:hypothetical protein